MDLATQGGGDEGGRESGSIVGPDVFLDCTPFGIASVELTGWVPKAAFIPVVAAGLHLGLATLVYILLMSEVGMGIAERSLFKLSSMVELGLYVLYQGSSRQCLLYFQE